MSEGDLSFLQAGFQLKERATEPKSKEKAILLICSALISDVPFRKS
jgi:hypothetical protein